MSNSSLYNSHISLTEWYQGIDHRDTEELRVEDNLKRDRMAHIAEITPFPFDKPVTFPASAIANEDPAFTSYLEKHGNELCALRLIPLEQGLPKLRMRGQTVRDVTSGWFQDQQIDPAQYRVDIVPHSDNCIWSTIFVVNEHGVFGDIIRGGHVQLTHGSHEDETPITFSYDFQNWHLSRDDADAMKELQAILSYLHVSDTKLQSQLTKKLDATFTHDHLCGYFETVTTEEFGLWFIDYNRILGKRFADMQVSAHDSNNGIVHGQTGCGGTATGTVRIVSESDISSADFNKGDVLVCDVTTPLYLPLMKKAAAIVTDRGGILSHAAIVSRELGVPCVVGTGDATSVLKSGDVVVVDGDAGTVSRK